MSMRTSFEDRLLDELKREIELRQAGMPGIRVAEGGMGEGGVNASARRRFTPRRIVLVAAACVVAGLAAVLVPGAPADSTAYAVERHGDGSVTLTVKDQQIGVEVQRGLARRLRSNGIQVTVNVLAPGYICEADPLLWAVDKQGERVPVLTVQLNRDITLRPGDVLVFDNRGGDSAPHRVNVYATEGEVEPCVPVRIPLPDDSPPK
ncbi:hypothetical protein PUR57_33845 [Streptomyces sp. JV176]|uniref:hypothetical protein n=1 Tax=Streptomyces sp. JV176 TaxID=858630 RepID=UPI002E778CE1|nr:hypothetical protein [Streptomyces sp. JV176]MEE1803594.1 hypothetical protein [Streptomyces sp. JV176]